MPPQLGEPESHLLREHGLSLRPQQTSESISVAPEIFVKPNESLCYLQVNQLLSTGEVVSEC